MVHQVVELSGHLIDSDILRKTFARIVEEGGEFEVLEFQIGKTNDDPSAARILVRAGDPHRLDRILESLSYLGASAEVADARFAPAEADGILPDEFYSTTNFETFVRIEGVWHTVRAQKMDCALVMRERAPTCVKQRLVRRGEAVMLRGCGVRVVPPQRSRGYSVFGFMSNDVSSEVNKGIAIAGIAREMKAVRQGGGKIALVAGPAIVHSGGDAALGRMV